MRPSRRDIFGAPFFVLWPSGAWAQSRPRVHRIAMVLGASPITALNESGEFGVIFQELRRLGYIEGENLEILRHSGEGKTEHYAEMADAVVRSAPDLIFVFSARLVQHFKDITDTIPVVAYTTSPVELGFARSLARPGGNITGVDPGAGIEFHHKLLETVKEVIPAVSRVAYLAPTRLWEHPLGLASRNAAEQMGISLVGALLASPIQEEEFKRVFAEMAANRPDALIVPDTPENYAHRKLIVDLAEKARLVAAYPDRAYVAAGGLMAYGIDRGELYKHVAGQIAQVLRGAKPGDIPFYQSTKFVLTLNSKTATGLGIEFPRTLLVRAVEVLE